ncbi:MAG: hypothetical protein ACR2GW_15060 [Pyrinomonadaceae bacterium]
MHGNFTRHTPINRLAASALLVLCFVQLPVRAHPPALITGAAQSSHLLYQDIFIPIGLARGQTLRYTWANLNDPDPQQRELEPLRIEVKLRAADGSVIAQAGAATVGAGQFQSFDFNRDALPLAGEPGTGRLQVQVQAQLFIAKPKQQSLREAPELFPASLEIIDNSTGQTAALLPVVQQLRCTTQSNGETTCRIVAVK